MGYVSRDVKLARHRSRHEADVELGRVLPGPLREADRAAESIEHLGRLLLGEGSKLVFDSGLPTTRFLHALPENHSSCFYFRTRFVETHACAADRVKSI